MPTSLWPSDKVSLFENGRPQSRRAAIPVKYPLALRPLLGDNAGAFLFIYGGGLWRVILKN
ncbi:MAG: hypothetical protein COB93_06125 [Sneathiella sp.]|nr:MAG: hypothetical protein COB93_06125 [Sneathiella sp.]